MPYVVSTMTDSVKYAIYGKTNPDLPSLESHVLIHGGANVANEDGIGIKSAGAPIWTPRGIATKVSNEQAELLEKHPLFQLHYTNGFVQILGDSDVNADEVALDMEAADKAAPLTDAKLEAEGLPTPEKGKK